MGSRSRARTWIDTLHLVPHPEGGWYRETYRNEAEIGPCCVRGPAQEPRSVSTAIYYLLEAGQCSHLHRIRSDEVWHHYDGDLLELHLLHEDGRHETLRLGTDPRAGIHPQLVVPAGTWFGARLAPGAEMALVGCTVAPGFDFRDFELGRRQELLRRHPAQAALIRFLTAPDPGLEA